MRGQLINQFSVIFHSGSSTASFGRCGRRVLDRVLHACTAYGRLLCYHPGCRGRGVRSSCHVVRSSGGRVSIQFATFQLATLQLATLQLDTLQLATFQLTTLLTYTTTRHHYISPLYISPPLNFATHYILPPLHFDTITFYHHYISPLQLFLGLDQSCENFVDHGGGYV
jgi:hypothetical protein